MLDSLIEKQFVRVGDINLHVVTAGNKDGEPVILLHGFPEFWYGWRHQIPYLAENGYRVIVPDQRGYNLSDKPDGISSYTIDILATDIRNLINVLGYDKVNLVGHDWGAAVAWWVATLYPEAIKKLIILNVPYPSVMAKSVRSGNLKQIFKSWYIGFFQMPKLPEMLLTMFNARGLANMLRMSGKRNTFTDEDIQRYQEAWSQPQAVHSMLNWYRAMVKRTPTQPRLKRHLPIQPPTLMLWGERDVALSKELAQPSIERCENGELIFFPNATHWVQHDEAQAVNQHIHEFLSGE